jgi:hypothetical protein
MTTPLTPLERLRRHVGRATGFRVPGDDGTDEEEIADLGAFLRSTPESSIMLDSLMDEALEQEPHLPQTTIEMLRRGGTTKLTIMVLHSLYMKAHGYSAREWTTDLIDGKLVKRVRKVTHPPDDEAAKFLYYGMSTFD